MTDEKIKENEATRMEVVNKIHNACERGSFKTADAVLADYVREVKKEAERLAKIEVLEKLQAELFENGEYDYTIDSLIDKYIEELKAGQ